MKVVELAMAERPPNQEVVSILERLLDEAMSGNIQGIAVAAGTDSRCTASEFALGDLTVADLYLAIERLKLRLLDHEGE